VAPDTTPVTLQTAVPAWTYGAYSLDFIPAGATTQKFAIVGCGFAQPDTNGDYTVEFTQRDIRVPTQTLPAGMHIHFSFNLRTRDSIIFYVESEFPVNTYVVDQTGLDNFKQGLQFTYYGGFLNQTIHRNRVRIPFAGIWYFIIDNPSTYQSTAIHYEVS
jgi:hypothetical protein